MICGRICQRLSVLPVTVSMDVSALIRQLTSEDHSPISSLMQQGDRRLILPYLEENERLFGISIERDLLTVDGQRRSPVEVYRKIGAVKLKTLVATTAKEKDR